MYTFKFYIKLLDTYFNATCGHQNENDYYHQK